MKFAITTTAALVLAVSALGYDSSPQLPADDAVRIREFYRLAARIQDRIWPEWGRTPAPLLLVTEHAEFLTHHPAPTQDFSPLGNGFYVRPRHFDTNLLATFPAFGPPSVIVVGEPSHTPSKTSTPWLITLMHEHFHQLQDAQPEYFHATQELGLSRGDNTGMWMLNYPFPYEQPAVAQSFSKLRDLLLRAIHEPDRTRFNDLERQYLRERRNFEASLSADDRKYFEFQLWHEGIARYTQVKCAEAARHYQASAEYTRLPDFETFTSYGAQARTETLAELKHTDLRVSKRTAFYSFGAAEGWMLDRVKPGWQRDYFKHQLSMAFFFEH